ncbi:MAG TPA: bifunctional hydroxymethylpyrimidine kinase/phosphomethylpyrimidine kinase [Planctomycetota bacterium]|nr:bifunctional hydroxymethylpyrimidine kinase/phosphomethylpyrimidine kinase [Planctomycetota bacterium]
MFTALTIAGSDPSGGAGVQGDLKTFQAHGVYGMAVLTALTAQNTKGVSGVHDVPAPFVARQIEAVLTDIPVGAAKTGMLSAAETVEVVASVLSRLRVPHLIVDPVMVATSGDALLRDDAVAVLLERLFPLATLVTPNLPEAERLADMRIGTVEEMRRAAVRLRERGAQAVLVKGGHLPGDQVIDLLYADGAFHEFSGKRIRTEHTHGTGCALSAGIAAQLARGADLMEAVGRSRAFVRRGLERAIPLGRGASPINHLAAGG